MGASDKGEIRVAAVKSRYQHHLLPRTRSSKTRENIGTAFNDTFLCKDSKRQHSGKICISLRRAKKSTASVPGVTVHGAERPARVPSSGAGGGGAQTRASSMLELSTFKVRVQ